MATSEWARSSTSRGSPTWPVWIGLVGARCGRSRRTVRLVTGLVKLNESVFDCSSICYQKVYHKFCIGYHGGRSLSPPVRAITVWRNATSTVSMARVIGGRDPRDRVWKPANRVPRGRIRPSITRLPVCPVRTRVQVRPLPSYRTSHCPDTADPTLRGSTRRWPTPCRPGNASPLAA